MSAATEVYDQMKQLFMEFAIPAETIKVALVDSTYVFDQTDTLFADVSGDEVSGTGYTAGGDTLTNATVLATGAFDADNTVWSGATISGIRRAIVYVVGTVDGKINPLLFSILLDDTPADISVTSSTLTLNYNALGLVVV